ncbi:MAG: hypothetical protein ACPGN3_07565 [Opitutales bacterium]
MDFRKCASLSDPQTYISRRRSGFALVVALALTTFMVLLVLSITVLSRQETKTYEFDRGDVQARQNALFAMRMAMGELQESLGPDQRVSAQADLFNTSDLSRRHVVGVWASADIANEGLTKGELVNWLVSDARDADGILDPAYNQASAPIADGSDSATLVGSGSVNSGNDEEVIVDLSNTVITDGSNTVGRYAWWIGDEGTKARVNLGIGDYSTSTDEEEKFRTVSFSNALTRNIPSALSGLESIDFALSGERIDTLEHMEILADNQEEVDKDYFHHLTPNGRGVLSDLRFGGLKKDLSLAFEMDDSAFDASEFAGAGPDAYRPWDSATFDVQPVFMLENSTGTDAHGPNWHVLRDYYTIYHRMETPMTDPTFEAQIMGPNLEHSNPRYDQPSAANNEGARQPAFLLAGGLPEASGGVSDSGSSQSSIMIANFDIDSDGHTHYAGPEHDPLRSREASTSAPLPTIVSASYIPFFTRFVREYGIWFEDQGSMTPEYKGYRSARCYFVFHNPYNVTITHGDLVFEERSHEMTLDIYDGAFPSTTKLYSSSDNMSAESDRTSVTRAAVESSSMSPGSFLTYQGVSFRTSDEYSASIPSGDYPAWVGADNPDPSFWRNLVGSTATGDPGLTFSTAGPFSLAVRPRVARNVDVVGSGLTQEYTLWHNRMFFSAQENGPNLTGGDQRRLWPHSTVSYQRLWDHPGTTKATIQPPMSIVSRWTVSSTMTHPIP